MKNLIILLSVALLSVTTGFAQDASTEDSGGDVLKSKRGYVILPEADEWGLGVSADPFLQFFGNIANGGDYGGGDEWDFPNNPMDNIALFGKLIVDENTAYRVRFNFSKNKEITKQVVDLDELTPDPDFPAFTQDWRHISSTNLVIAGGLEKRRGSSRVQGIYGGEVIIGLSSAKSKFEDGNSISADFNAPNTGFFSDNVVTGDNFVGGGRVISEKSGTNFFAGVRGFIGVEYFVAPKISIGGEFGYVLGASMQGKGSFTTEEWSGITNGIVETEEDVYLNDGFSSFGIGLDNMNGSVNVLFYF